MFLSSASVLEKGERRRARSNFQVFSPPIGKDAYSSRNHWMPRTSRTTKIAWTWGLLGKETIHQNQKPAPLYPYKNSVFTHHGSDNFYPQDLQPWEYLSKAAVWTNPLTCDGHSQNKLCWHLKTHKLCFIHIKKSGI